MFIELAVLDVHVILFEESLNVSLQTARNIEDMRQFVAHIGLECAQRFLLLLKSVFDLRE